jgi:hypothetical protein
MLSENEYHFHIVTPVSSKRKYLVTFKTCLSMLYKTILRTIPIETVIHAPSDEYVFESLVQEY